MESKSKTTVCGWKITIIVLTSIFFLGELLWSNPAGTCEAKEKREEEKVEAFIKAYYKAYSEENVNSLKEYIQDEEELEEEIIRLEALRECGFVRYDYIDALIYPLSDKTHWIVFASSELVIEELDDTLPGVRPILVGKNEDGDFYIEVDEDLTDDMVMEVREIALSDEVYNKSNEIACRYNDILAKNQDVMDWVMSASDMQTKAIARAYEERSRDDKEDYYRVRKGDCLWSIAEKKFGDGMYWGDIYEVNQKLIGDNPNLLYIGIELKLPEDLE